MNQPKLLKNRPKKGARVEAARDSKAKESKVVETVVSSHKEPFLRRYGYALPALLAVNLVVGGYVLFRTKTKTADLNESREDAPLATETMPQPVSTIRSPPGEK